MADAVDSQMVKRSKAIRSFLIGVALCLATTIGIQIRGASAWQEEHAAAEQKAHEADMLKVLEKIHRDAFVAQQASIARKASLEQCLADGHDRDGCLAVFQASFPAQQQAATTTVDSHQ